MPPRLLPKGGVYTSTKAANLVFDTACDAAHLGAATGPARVTHLYSCLSRSTRELLEYIASLEHLLGIARDTYRRF